LIQIFFKTEFSIRSLIDIRIRTILSSQYVFFLRQGIFFLQWNRIGQTDAFQWEKYWRNQCKKKLCIIKIEKYNLFWNNLFWIIANCSECPRCIPCGTKVSQKFSCMHTKGYCPSTFFRFSSWRILTVNAKYDRIFFCMKNAQFSLEHIVSLGKSIKCKNVTFVTNENFKDIFLCNTIIKY